MKMNDDDILYFISLKCTECENPYCTIHNKKWIHPDDILGCTRNVNEDTAIEYEHYKNEIIPFLYINTTKNYQDTQYKAYINLLDYIYTCPLGQRLKDYKTRL